MKINEVVKMMQDPKMAMLKPEQLQKVLMKELQVKPYISLKKKRVLIEDIINKSILYEDGIYKFDEIDKYVALVMLTIATYTNIELSDDIEEDYDALCETGVLSKILNTFDEEYQAVAALLQMRCNYVLTGNSLESQVGTFLNGVSEKMDVLTNSLVQKIDNFSIDDLNVSQEDMKNIVAFLDAVK